MDVSTRASIDAGPLFVVRDSRVVSNVRGLPFELTILSQFLRIPGSWVSLAHSAAGSAAGPQDVLDRMVLAAFAAAVEVQIAKNSLADCCFAAIDESIRVLTDKCEVFSTILDRTRDLLRTTDSSSARYKACAAALASARWE